MIDRALMDAGYFNRKYYCNTAPQIQNFENNDFLLITPISDKKLISCRHHSSCRCNFEIDVAQNLYDRPAAFQSNTATPFANERGVRCHFLDHPNISWA